MIKWPEPAVHMWQHEETGRVGFVEASQPLDQWTKANPRLAIVAKIHTEAQLKQAVRDAYEDAAKVAATTCHHEATFFANGFNQAALNIEAGIRALIKELPHAD